MLPDAASVLFGSAGAARAVSGSKTTIVAINNTIERISPSMLPHLRMGAAGNGASDLVYRRAMIFGSDQLGAKKTRASLQSSEHVTAPLLLISLPVCETAH